MFTTLPRTSDIVFFPLFGLFVVWNQTEMFLLNGYTLSDEPTFGNRLKMLMTQIRFLEGKRKEEPITQYFFQHLQKKYFQLHPKSLASFKLLIIYCMRVYKFIVIVFLSFSNIIFFSSFVLSIFKWAFLLIFLCIQYFYVVFGRRHLRVFFLFMWHTNYCDEKNSLARIN